MSGAATDLPRPLSAARRPIIRPHRSRAAILAAARTLFRGRPSETVSMEMIAARAGVTRRTVYNQFADAAELFRATREELILEVAALLPLDVGGNLPPRLALGAYCSEVAHAFSDPRFVELLGSILRDGWSAPWFVEAYQRHIRLPVVRRLETYLQALQPGPASEADMSRAALSLLASIESIVLSTRLLPGIDCADDDLAECPPEVVDGFIARVLPAAGAGASMHV